MRQPYQLAIALRYLRMRSRHGFISFISTVSMLGIAVAVAVLIIVLSVTNGFYYELQERTLGMVSHATISPFSGRLDDWQVLQAAAVARPDIAAAAPYIDGQGMLFAGAATAGINIRGIRPEQEAAVSAVADYLVAGTLSSLEPGSYRVVLGSRLAERLAVTVGDDVVLMLAQANVTPLGTLPRQRALRVAGIFDSGLYEYDRGLAMLHFDDASRLFRTGGQATGLRLAVTDIFAAAETAAALARQLGGGYFVSDWSLQQGAFFRSIQISKAILAVILSLIIGVAAFNIVSTLVMVVREKRGDIAILRSLGASASSMVGIFTSQGVLIGLTGTVLGCAAGIGLAVNLPALVALAENMLGMELFTGEAYMVTSLPSRVNVIEVLNIAGLAFLLAMLATIYPALSAARQAPAEALRHE